VIIEAVWRAGAFSGTGVSMAGSVEVTTLHPPGSGDPKLPPVPNVAPSSSEDSPRVVRIEGDPLWTIPMNIVPKSLPWGKRLRHPRQSAMNPRLSKWMVLPGAKPNW
jgi:hypothetical protein